MPCIIVNLLLYYENVFDHCLFIWTWNVSCMVTIPLDRSARLDGHPMENIRSHAIRTGHFKLITRHLFWCWDCWVSSSCCCYEKGSLIIWNCHLTTFSRKIFIHPSKSTTSRPVGRQSTVSTFLLEWCKRLHMFHTRLFVGFKKKQLRCLVIEAMVQWLHVCAHWQCCSTISAYDKCFLCVYLIETLEKAT